MGGRPTHVINAVLPTGEQKFDQASASLRNPDLIRLGKRFVAADADAILALLPTGDVVSGREFQAKSLKFLSVIE